MQTHYRKQVALAATVVLSACAPAVVVDTVGEETAVRARSAAYLDATQAKDINRLLTFMAPNAVMAGPNQEPVTGADQLRGMWQEMFAAPNVSLSWRPTMITVSSGGDLATEYGTYEWAFDAPGGRTTDRGHYTTVWRKIDGEWLVASDMATSSQPPAAATAASVNVTFDTSTAHEMLGAGAVNWQPFASEGFPSGASIAVIHGDPSGTGDYTLRLRFPDGYKTPVHWHGKAKHITVLSGQLNIAMGGEPNAATHSHRAGDFLYVPARAPHLETMIGETILQLHGMGPLTINLGTP